uniref:right-handed parallel beta-helix repeat-containing protein n=1 Tax=Klebsiella quasipneumoniae TaxID=1463165 RepID=UPI00352B4A05
MAEVPLPTPTQVPVPSTDIRNAVFAGAKLDEEVTGTGEFYTDRLGVKRLTNTGRNNQFDAAQLDRANRFEQFLLSSGYVFLGDYEDGPFQFSARNQYIRYNSQYYRLNAATDVGFTTTGTDATSFVNDVTHFVLMDGDTLRQNLGSSEGTSLIVENEATVAQLLAPSIFKYMTQADIFTMLTTVGADVNIDYALQKAIDKGVMSVVMPWRLGIYNASQDVSLPSGFCIFSEGSRRIYTAANDAAFNNAGVVIRKAAGATGIFKMTSRHTFKDLIFDGRDKTVGMINADVQPAGLTFINCSSYRWLRGFGRTSGYVGTLRAINCTANNNYDGFYNSIDSWYLNCVANANDNQGFNFQTGANNNTMTNCTPEWNAKEGVMVYGAKVITITGDKIDRNGSAGLSIKNGGLVHLNGVRFQRNGAAAVAGSSDNCHILMEGDGSTLYATGISSVAGVDDDGGGNLSPQYGIITTGSSTNMKIVIGDGDMSGATVSPIRSIVTAAVRKFRNVIGLPDVSTEGLTQIRDGVPNIGDPILNANLPVHGTIPFTLKQLFTGRGTYSTPITRTIEFECRNESQGVPESYFLRVRTSRVTASDAIITVLGAETGSASNWGMASSAPAAVAITLSVSADGQTISGTLEGIDNGNRYIDIFLRP